MWCTGFNDLLAIFLRLLIFKLKSVTIDTSICSNQGISIYTTLLAC